MNSTFLKLIGRGVNDSFDFVFIVHPRSVQDIHRKYHFTKYVPEYLLKKIFNKLPFIKVATIECLVKEKKKRGIIISLSMTSDQMLLNRKVAKRKVVKVLKKAKKIGAKHVGLGAFTSVVTSGGTEVKDVVKGVHVTNGNALTSYVTYIELLDLIKKHKKTKPNIAIIGATGSIGSAVTKLLVKDGVFGTLYIVGRTPSRIKNLLETIKPHPHSSRVLDTKIEKALPKSDIILSATSASGAVVDERFLKENVIIYDITQPKNISENVLKSPDVVVYDGGIIDVPNGIKINGYIGLEKGKMYSCLAETILLSLEEYPDNFCLGHATLEKVSYIAKLSTKYKFTQTSNSKFNTDI